MIKKTYNLQLTTSGYESGQVLVISVIFLVVMLVLVSALANYVSLNTRAGRTAYATEQALQLADAGIDKAVWQLNETAGAYTGETGTVLGAGTFTTSVANLSSSLKEVTVTAYVPNSTAPVSTKQVKVQVSIDSTTISFSYGVQVGDGGLSMGQDTSVTGNVYVNGTISGASGANISGDAYSAGSTGRIQSVTVGGTAYAHTIQSSTVGGNARGYALTGSRVGGNALMYSLSNCTIGGNASYTTKSSCTIGGTQTTPYAGEPDPAAQTFPIPDQQITDWKNQAAAGGTISGNYTIGQDGSATLGPKKISGNLVMGKNATLTLSGLLWVTGSIDIDKDATVALASSYGGNSEVLIADGVIDLSKEVNFQPAGSGSYILAISMSSSGSAVTIAKSADALIVYAPNGTVQVQKSSVLREVTAYGLSLVKDTEVIYESGLADVNFTSGPGASWEILRGTWRETN